MEPIEPITKAPPTPAERNAWRWLVLMGVVVVVLTVATGVWFLSQKDRIGVVAVDGLPETTVLPPLSLELASDVSAAGPAIRLTEELGIATGTITVAANDVAAADDVRVPVQLIVDGGADGVRLILETTLGAAAPIDRFVVGRQRIRLDEPGWRLRCVDVDPCTQRIDYRMEIPNDAIVIDVAWQIGVNLNHPDGEPPAGSAATIAVDEPDIVDVPYLTSAVGTGIDEGVPQLAAVRVTMPAGFDDPTIELLAFARLPGAVVTTVDPATGRVTGASDRGVIRIDDPIVACPSAGPDCLFDVWVLVEPGDTAESGSLRVEARAQDRQPPQMQLHAAEPTVVADEGDGSDVEVGVDAEGDAATSSLRAVLVAAPLEGDAGSDPTVSRDPVVVPLCDPGCRVSVPLQGFATATPGAIGWRIVGFLVSVEDVVPPGNPTLTMRIGP